MRASVRGATGELFDTVLNIGIGGSDLGPRMVSEALTMVDGGRLRACFLSNVDGHAFAALARTLDPARTLVLVASKTFTTLETMTNAHAVRAWLVAALGEAAVGGAFRGAFHQPKAVAAFGIAPERMFGFRDWVGGRYSVWSLDRPVGGAGGGVGGVRGAAGRRAGDGCAFPHRRLAREPAGAAGAGRHLACRHPRLPRAVRAGLRRPAAALSRLSPAAGDGEQRQVGGAGRRRRWRTPPARSCSASRAPTRSTVSCNWSTRARTPVPVDFILAADAGPCTAPEAHRILAANAFAQAEALLRGQDRARRSEAEMRAQGVAEATIAAVAPHRVFAGNRPSTTILFRRLDAFSLGRLIALYEHKVAVQGRLWGIDSFDQWGVELGKELAGGILPGTGRRRRPARMTARPRR